MTSPAPISQPIANSETQDKPPKKSEALTVCLIALLCSLLATAALKISQFEATCYRSGATIIKHRHREYCVQTGNVIAWKR